MDDVLIHSDIRYRTRPSNKIPTRLQDFVVNVSKSTGWRWSSTMKVPQKYVDNFDAWLALPKPCEEEVKKGAKVHTIAVETGYAAGHLVEEMVDKDWFIRLTTPFKELDREQVDACLHVVAKQNEKHPETCVPNTTICYADLAYFLAHVEDESRVEEHIVLYLTTWHGNTVAYMPLSTTPVGNHWVTVEVSIPDWKIRIYDCYLGNGVRNEVMECYEKLKRNLRRLLQHVKCVDYVPEMIEGKEFALEIVSKQFIPQMYPAGDCGMFAVKHIEHLVHGEDFSLIVTANMPYIRKLFAYRIFNRCYDA